MDIARRAFEAVTPRPKADFDTVNALYHPEHEFVSMVSRVEGDSFIGASGYREFVRTFEDSFESWEMPIAEIRSIDAERVLIAADLHARSTTGGVPVDQQVAHVVTVRDGKVTRSESYSSPAGALAAIER